MLADRLKSEAGYSLVEVLMAILILSIAIIPMVGMFDVGLKSASLGGNYDRARALANANLEEVKAMPFANAIATYKPVNDGGSATSCRQALASFTCTVTTNYVNDDFNNDPSYKNQMKIDVTVTWEGSKSYTTTGFKVK